MIESNSSRLNESFLQILNVRHQTIAENIANADTPHYKKKTVVFEDELRRAISGSSRDDLEIRQTHSRHFGIKDNNASLIPYQIVRNTDTAMNNNGNNVDMDLEMANLAENQLMYNYMADKVSGHYTKIRDMLQNLK
ncbi:MULTISPECIES: flagellar basal body rod protein FlgB [unclassified Paenibacillus]|uniref:flagellar basal body rod protein FlgB n=1 Tax=unclassified Paenibacillus TaxID=185978 RepID=UPI00240493BE|nr:MULTISPECIES: flagellar basal body rod protein FlgB [unclassified Paenibacillus]MDF9842599.1 flagellar basal-body rod protein FlgB [Paenibacillus sp. PastF-2]MDF9849194.1 flagellar basal-body rod protein FlgB [Paenibacillus sp. PastM-2]MDF9855759.1 flagellar basal-body rod protein FlgB [Paenibacillus sp. PastF-1]MDH6481037.1 flagellar basal-body rod protein FlgB [Paenibacillus sp. PastH-2]MDH6508451.1 flagellar basal-body rod protein FlgB [Paenibacillus sp. PastM-3]